MKSPKSVSLVLAGYNEEGCIEESMRLSYEALSGAFETFEMILVDDASKDGTLERMRRFAEGRANVTALSNYVNLNFGTAVLRGLLASSHDYVVYNACDLPLSPEDMARLILQMDEGTDVLVLERTGYRTTRWRGITSDLNRLLLKLLYPRLTKGTPVLNYVQVYRRRSLQKLLPLARSPIFVWPEMVFRAKLAGLKVENAPAACRVENVRRGAFGHPHDIIWGIYDMLRFRVRVWLKNY